MSKRKIQRKQVATSLSDQIELSESQKIAVEAVQNDLNRLNAQRQQFLQVEAQLLKRKAALISEIEQQYRLPRGSIESGVWAVFDGHLVRQSALPQQDTQTKKDVKANAA